MKTPVHPGEVLQEELDERGLTAGALARSIRVPANRVWEIIKGRRGITADTALRLGRFFGTSAELWMNLQQRYELESARDQIGDEVDRLIEPHQGDVA